MSWARSYGSWIYIHLWNTASITTNVVSSILARSQMMEFVINVDFRQIPRFSSTNITECRYNLNIVELRS